MSEARDGALLRRPSFAPSASGRVRGSGAVLDVHHIISSAIAAVVVFATSPAISQDLALCAMQNEELTGAATPAMGEAVEIPAGAAIQLEFVDTPDSRSSHRGDRFALRVASALEVDGHIVVPEGAHAIGEVVDAWPSDSGGQPGMLVLAVRSVELDGRSIPVTSPTLMLSGRDNIDTSHAASLLVSPLFTFVEGTDIRVQPGTRVEATISAAATPTGSGQIVFFRPRRNSAGAYRYGVREAENDIRLRNGSYYVLNTPAGIHEFALVGTYLGGAPRQTLRLNLQPGEVLYVEHAISFLVASNQAAFETQRNLREERPAP